ncbi:hypothetical protein EVAR_20237_1 [Eumeta japonica]|uniref:Uncharacterized protein n=1 Tax=Eumeta variegata TaxID=151549 RepID=A0A4C1W890_EUMVA|nr:hypothetical protein EVAR_20237_1 [Eumeta japonica]
MCALTAAWAAWTWARLHSWWVTEGEVATRRGARVAERLSALLESVAELPGGAGAARLLELEREARVVGMRLVRTWGTVGGLLVILQVVALALAVAALIVDRKRVQVTRAASPLLSR